MVCPRIFEKLDQNMCSDLQTCDSGDEGGESADVGELDRACGQRPVNIGLVTPERVYRGSVLRDMTDVPRQQCSAKCEDCVLLEQRSAK